MTSVPAGSTLTTVSAGDGGFSLKVGQPEEEGYYPSGSMVIRLGEVDRYNVILALQYILRAQIKSLLQAINLDDDNGLTRRRIELSVRKVWILFIGTLGVEYDEDEILQDSPVTSPSSSGIYAADSAGSSRGSSPAPPSTTVVSMELLDEILNSQPLTSITQEAPPRIPRPKRSFPHTGSVNRKPIERVGLISLLAIIYLGLLEAGVPILVADLRRLLIHKILPYGDAAVRAAIPTPLRRELEAKKWGVIFKPKVHKKGAHMCSLLISSLLVSPLPLLFPSPLRRSHFQLRPILLRSLAEYHINLLTRPVIIVGPSLSVVLFVASMTSYVCLVYDDRE